MKRTYKWLDHAFIYGPYLALCLTEEDFRRVLKHLKIKTSEPFINTSQAHATKHTFESKGKQTVVVCIRDWGKRDVKEIYGLLIHEAVHIFQGWCEHHGESNPSLEFEAYSIQWIAQQLIYDFDRQVNRARHGAQEQR